MWLAVNKQLGHFSLLWKLAFLFTEQKMRALILQMLGVCCSGLHFRELACCLYGDTQTYIPHVHKQTHARAMYRNHVIHRQEAEIQKNTHTRIPCNKEPTVCGGEMNCLHCIIRMTHQTVINENRMKVLSKEKNADMKCVSKQKEAFGRNPVLYIALGSGGVGHNQAILRN